MIPTIKELLNIAYGWMWREL